MRPVARAAALAAALLAAVVPARAESVLKLAMTASDIPTARGAPDQGAEGIRWMGFTIYDSLLYWNLNQSETIPELVPALAESWSVDADDKSKWTFRLRRDVTFHDGSRFDADAVVWNLDKLFTKDAPHYDLQQYRAVGWRTPDIKTWRKLDDYTVEIGTGTPNSSLPDEIVYVHMSSPARWKALGSWEKFAEQPSGTGPFRVERIVPREQAILVRNAAYWDKTRVPKLDRLILLPIPEAATRTAALLSGQVNFIEAPAPDAVPRLRAAGMQVMTNPYPHAWPYVLRIAGGDTPLADVRVRRALNLAIDRAAIVELLGGMAVAAKGHVQVESPWFGQPQFELKHDPEGARRLLAEAGYGPGKPLVLTVMISPSGSGQMQPLTMNELIQEQMKAVGIDLRFKTVDWETLRTQRAKPPTDPTSREIHAVNTSLGVYDPYSAFTRLFASRLVPPAGINWGGVDDPVVDALLKKLEVTFDPAEQNAVLRPLHERIVEQAYWLWVVHDVNPRAMAANVRGFQQAKSWYQDLTQITVGP